MIEANWNDRSSEKPYHPKDQVCSGLLLYILCVLFLFAVLVCLIACLLACLFVCLLACLLVCLCNLKQMTKTEQVNKLTCLIK